MKIIPPLSWFLQPSGGPVKSGFMGWLGGIKRRPIIAHPIGAALIVAVFLWLWPDAPMTMLIAIALLAEAVNQYYKAIRGVYGQWLWREVSWRMLLAFVGALVTILIWR